MNSKYKDTNGKIICKGDIIYADQRKTGFFSDINTYGKIKFSDEEKHFYFKSPWNHHGILLDKEYCKQMEVIGNIYDNPSLLEEKLIELENKMKKDSPWLYEEEHELKQGDLFI
jgi:hypothetical protein